MTHIGLDLGTSSVKAVVVDQLGEVISSGQSAHATVSVLAGQAEQEPGSWLRAAAAAVGEAMARLEPQRRASIVSIGLTGQLPTLVCLGDQGPLGPAIAWTDSRADSWACERLGSGVRDRLYRTTGMPIDGRYLAPMFRFHWWDRRHEVRHILSAKDYLYFALTGRCVTDPSTAAGYATYALGNARWDPELCALWDLDPALLPDVEPSDSTAGVLDDAGARLLGLPAGLPVSVGAADSVAGALVMGGLDERCASIVMGSSTIIIAATALRQLDSQSRYLLTPHAAAGWYGREMDLLSTGTGFRWLSNLLGFGADTGFEERALSAPAGANGVIFAPYLAGGEQGALWNPHLGGVIHGLGLRHTGSDVARAYFEGIFFEMRRCLEVLEEITRIERVVVSGHAACNTGIMAMLADVLGRPVQAFTHPSPSAIGAAMLASKGSVKAPRSALTAAIQPGSATTDYQGFYQRYAGLFPRIADAARS